MLRYNWNIELENSGTECVNGQSLGCGKVTEQIKSEI